MSSKRCSSSVARRLVLASVKFKKGGVHRVAKKRGRADTKLKIQRGQWHDPSQKVLVMSLALGGHDVHFYPQGGAVGHSSCHL